MMSGTDDFYNGYGYEPDGFDWLYYMNVRGPKRLPYRLLEAQQLTFTLQTFRILADISHFASKAILIWAIHRNKSAEGVSLITQALYAFVFCTRYIDLIWKAPKQNWWNFFFKIFYIVSSFYILLLMTKVYARTREREKAWRIATYSLLGSIILSPVITSIAQKTWFPSFSEDLVVFSLMLESVCILPQLLLLRQTTVPTVIDSYYLVALGAYRALYIGNWIERYVSTDPVKPEPISVIFGVIQTLFYLDFAWVYYTRQRVKLRGGGIVDSDDLSKSWVLRRVLAARQSDDADDEESRPALGDDAEYGADDATRRSAAPRGGWGKRGISVRADDTLPPAEWPPANRFDDADGEMRDPDELDRALADDSDDENHPGVQDATPTGNGREWRAAS
jgi:hypothetical protein